MSRKELLKYCRYYKGESTCPASLSNDEALIWEYEQRWAGIEGTSQMDAYIETYIKAFPSAKKENEKDYSLIAFLFGRFSRVACGSPAEIKDNFEYWRENYYKP